MTQGTPLFTASEPDPEQCKLENEALIEYECHKKAKQHIDLVKATVHKEVAKGWVLILPPKSLQY
jgi:hypothetical protein